jgi:hypothetical protein
MLDCRIQLRSPVRLVDELVDVRMAQIYAGRFQLGHHEGRRSWSRSSTSAGRRSERHFAC